MPDVPGMDRSVAALASVAASVASLLVGTLAAFSVGARMPRYVRVEDLVVWGVEAALVVLNVGLMARVRSRAAHTVALAAAVWCGGMLLLSWYAWFLG